MKVHVKILFFFICCCVHFVSAQSIAPSSLKYNRKKLLCEKDSGNPYSGDIEGYLSFFQSVNIANTRYFGPMLNGLTLNSESRRLSGFYLIGKLSQGKEKGRWQYYTTDKILILEVTFVNGIIDGEVIHYYPDGTKKASVQYKKGKANGITVVYDEDGEVIEKSIYENGIFIKELVE